MNLIEHFPKLNERKVKLSALDIAPRVFTNWKQMGVIDYEQNLFDENESKKVSRRMFQFNAFEALWLLIVKELRMLHISLNTIKDLKAFLFASPFESLDETVSSIELKTVLSKTIDKELMQETGLDQMELDDIKKSFETLPESYKIFTTRIAGLFSAIYFSNHSPSLHIFKTPNSEEIQFFEFYPQISQAIAREHDEDFINILMKSMANYSIINIPIKPLLLQFFENELLFKYAKAFDLYTSAEIEILKIFRGGDFEKIIIHKNEVEKAITIEKTSKTDVKGENAKELRRELGIKKYERIEVICRNEKHLVLKNTLKTKIDLRDP